MLLTSCVSQSKSCNLSLFSDRINRLCDTAAFNLDDVEIIKNNDKTIAYWFPKADSNCCVSFYLNENTGNIEKCNIVFVNNKYNKEIVEKVKECLEYNNEYMTESKYKLKDNLMITFTDSRYEEKCTDKTLKKEIREEDLY